MSRGPGKYDDLTTLVRQHASKLRRDKGEIVFVYPCRYCSSYRLDIRGDPMKEQLFSLGRVVGTKRALKELDQSDVFEALLRHVAGDWGLVDAHDKEQNDWALLRGDRILSAYQSHGTRFWIITEADRDTTTILLPEEY